MVKNRNSQLVIQFVKENFYLIYRQISMKQDWKFNFWLFYTNTIVMLFSYLLFYIYIMNHLKKKNNYVEMKVGFQSIIYFILLY